MTRLSEAIKIGPSKQGSLDLDSYLWSYSFIKFLKFLFLRNRGYITRKIFNFIYEIIEISFLAYFCHPDFYLLLLFIPASSFFMNLINEELFNLNRSAHFDGNSISRRFNYLMIVGGLFLFYLFIATIASKIILNHWLFILISSLRMTLIGLQSFSFAYSLELTSARRIYFSPFYWIGAIGCCTLILLLSVNFMNAVLGVIIGVSFIYLSRMFVELAFIFKIKPLRAQFKFKTPKNEIKKTFLRILNFAITISVLYLSQHLLTNNTNKTALNFFLIIFGWRLINRPLRALQIDFLRYLQMNRPEWVYLRHLQIFMLQIFLVSMLFIFTKIKVDFSFFIFLLLTLNILVFSIFSSIGQDNQISKFYLPLMLISIFVSHNKIHPAFYFTNQIILSCFLLTYWSKKNSRFIPIYLSRSGIQIPFKSNIFATLKSLKMKNTHSFLLSFTSPSLSHFKKIPSIGLHPMLMINKWDWILPSDHQTENKLWLNFHRELRNVKTIKISDYFYRSIKQPYKLESIKKYAKVNNIWKHDNKKVEDYQLIIAFNHIEDHLNRARTIDELKINYHYHGRFFYARISAQGLCEIFETNFYDFRLTNYLKSLLWQELHLYFL